MSEGNGFAGKEHFTQGVRRRYEVVSDLQTLPPVRLQSLTEAESTRLQNSLLNTKGRLSSAGMMESRRRLMVLCIVDGEGNRLFTENDIGLLADMDAGDADKIFQACSRLAGVTNEQIEELVKNSETIHAASSP